MLLVAALALGCGRGERAGSGAERGDGTAAPVVSRTAPPVAATAPKSPFASSVRPRPGAASGVEVQPLGELVLDGAAQEGIVVRVSLERASVEPCAVPERRLPNLAADPTLLVAVNAGYFEADGAPTGLLAGAAVQYGLLGRRGGSGVAIVRDRRAAIEPYTATLTLGEPVELAVQSGPRLLEADGRAGIRADDGQRAPRTVLCVAEGGRRVDLVLLWARGEPARGPGLYALARALSAPLVAGDERRCEQALNLDGGPSTGLVFGPTLPVGEVPPHASLGPVPWALAVRGRLDRAARPAQGGSNAPDKVPSASR